jgi:putative RNA 2'-phosphotransferase
VTATIDHGKIVSTLAFALRHDPARFGLDLDNEGWTSLEDLVVAFRFDRYDWALVDEAVLRTAIEGMDRFQIRDGRIRAMYGHSVELGKLPPIALPPTVLFHGTTKGALPAIFRDGLRPIGRRFVHLTSDREYALRVAKAKQGQAVVLVRAAEVHAAGRAFRRANGHVWLTDQVEASFITAEPEPASA